MFSAGLRKQPRFVACSSALAHNSPLLESSGTVVYTTLTSAAEHRFSSTSNTESDVYCGIANLFISLSCGNTHIMHHSTVKSDNNIL